MYGGAEPAREVTPVAFAAPSACDAARTPAPALVPAGALPRLRATATWRRTLFAMASMRSNAALCTGTWSWSRLLARPMLAPVNKGTCDTWVGPPPE